MHGKTLFTLFLYLKYRNVQPNQLIGPNVHLLFILLIEQQQNFANLLQTLPSNPPSFYVFDAVRLIANDSKSDKMIQPNGDGQLDDVGMIPSYETQILSA